jgi:hypothetical protein
MPEAQMYIQFHPLVECHLDLLTCSPTKIQLHLATHMKIKNANPEGSPCHLFYRFLIALYYLLLNSGLL